MPYQKPEHLSKDEILKQCHDAVPTEARNRMGCDESWYNPFFAISNVFTDKQLNDMGEQELNNLVMLADAICSALY